MISTRIARRRLCVATPQTSVSTPSALGLSASVTVHQASGRFLPPTNDMKMSDCGRRRSGGPSPADSKWDFICSLPVFGFAFRVVNISDWFLPQLTANRQLLRLSSDQTTAVTQRLSSLQAAVLTRLPVHSVSSGPLAKYVFLLCLVLFFRNPNARCGLK